MLSNVYEAAGGEATFTLLVERFYSAVAQDPVLRAVYPEEDLSNAAERLRLFLIQYWGGPTTYNDLRGHPRLRMRHAPFAIGQEEREQNERDHRLPFLNGLSVALSSSAAVLDGLVMRTRSRRTSARWPPATSTSRAAVLYPACTAST